MKNGSPTHSVILFACTDSVNGNLFLSSHLFAVDLGKNCGRNKFEFSLLLLVLMLLGLMFADLGPVEWLQFFSVVFSSKECATSIFALKL